MSQLEELNKLYVNKKTYKIPKEPKDGEQQATIVIVPLDLAQMAEYEVDESASKEERQKQTMNLMATSLSVTVEDIKKISVEHMTDIMDAIFDANKIDDDKKQDALKKILKQQEKKD